MFNNINLNNLKYFYEVANTLNITKSAENLCISQPALTHAIKELESSLDTKLFIRNKRGVVLTETGKILYTYASNMFKDLNNVSRLIKEDDQDKHIYIGATTTNFLEPIKDTLAEFRKLHNDIKIEIEIEELSVLENHKKLNKLDILIKNDYENMDNMESINSFSITDSFICSSKYFGFLGDKTYSLEELLNYPFVLLSDITHGRRNFNNYLKQKGINFTPDYEFNSYSLCKELIRFGFGIGVGNPIHYQTDDFIIIKTNFSLPTRNFDICYNKDSSNAITHEFVEMLKNNI